MRVKKPAANLYGDNMDSDQNCVSQSRISYSVRGFLFCLGVLDFCPFFSLCVP